MCTYINVDPPLYGCQNVGTLLLTPNEGELSPKWTKETYKTADPTCAEYCEEKDQRCTYLTLKPLTYVCQSKVSGQKNNATKSSATQSATPGSEEKTWTKENYKTANPNCNDYCTCTLHMGP